MADPVDKKDKQADGEVVILRMVQQFNLVIIAVFTVGSWYIIDWNLAKSVLIGGVLASVSFFLLKRDAEQLIDQVAAGSQVQGVKGLAKSSFILKFNGRLIVLGLLLYVLTTKININIIGLVIGLSTVMLSVIIVVLTRGRMVFSGQSFKGA
jgi:hypothetical protein